MLSGCYRIGDQVSYSVDHTLVFVFRAGLWSKCHLTLQVALKRCSDPLCQFSLGHPDDRKTTMSTKKTIFPKASTSLQTRHFKRAQRVHQIGDEGQAWYVQSGAVRLDAMGPEGLTFAALAVTGDVIGTDALVGGHYAFEAHALTPCVLTPWKLSRTTPVLELMSAVQRRAAEVVALRCGSAEERVARLVRLLGNDGVQRNTTSFRVLTPRLRDVADITNLAPETVSRIANATRRVQ